MAPEENDRTREAPLSAIPGPAGRPDALAGRVLKGGYRIEGQIGQGGMGVVYRATQTALGRAVAVKTVQPDGRAPAVAVERFFREARLLSQLNHPNIVRIIDFGTDPGPLHFMVMEYLPGESLDDFVAKRLPLGGGLVLALMQQVCAAVTAAHELQVVHRDLKPSNIQVVSASNPDQPVVKVLDFGLGKRLAEEETAAPPGLTREGVMLGTCGYSAPEQLHGGVLDVRADVYGLGAVLYFLLSGRPPYLDEGFRSTLARQLTEPPDPLAPGGLNEDRLRRVEAVVRRAMSVRPADRYATPGALLADLSAALAGAPPGTALARPAFAGCAEGPTVVAPKPPSEAAATGRAPRLRWAWVALGLAGVLALLGGWLGSLGRKAETAPPGPAGDIVLGMSGPFSGPAKELGRGVKLGVETCLQSANGEGGVLGRRLRLVALDDGYEPEQARANMVRLLEEHGVFAFIGNVGTPTAEAALPVALRQRRVFFGAFSGSSVLRKDPPDRYVFNYRASYAEETAALVRHLVTVHKIAPEQMAVFAQNDAYGRDGVAGVEGAVRRLGHSPAGILTVGYDRNHNDVSKAVRAVLRRKDRVKAVILVATYHPASRFIHQLKRHKVTPLFASVSFVGSGPLVEDLDYLGGQPTKGIIVSQVVPHVASTAPGVARYRADLAAYMPAEPPGPASLEGYLAARALVEGLREAGPDLSPESLVAALERMGDLDLGVGAPAGFGPSRHQASHTVWLTELGERGAYSELPQE
jgi:ABC-type branched-subunit amino acid transport system substrate-binding protein